MVKKKTGRSQVFYIPDAINTALEKAHREAVKLNPATGSLSLFASHLIWEALETRSNKRKNDGD